MRPSGANIMPKLWLGKFPGLSENLGDAGSASSFAADDLHYLRANHFQGLSSTCTARPNFRQATLSPRHLNKDWIRLSEVFSILLQLPFQIYNQCLNCCWCTAGWLLPEIQAVILGNLMLYKCWAQENLPLCIYCYITSTARAQLSVSYSEKHVCNANEASEW